MAGGRVGHPGSAGCVGSVCEDAQRGRSPWPGCAPSVRERPQWTPWGKVLGPALAAWPVVHSHGSSAWWFLGPRTLGLQRDPPRARGCPVPEQVPVCSGAGVGREMPNLPSPGDISERCSDPEFMASETLVLCIRGDPSPECGWPLLHGRDESQTIDTLVVRAAAGQSRPVRGSRAASVKWGP